ncbi:MAG: response regulator [Bacteroidales bacterium]|jgi:CheY-like chemotaxis protein|nr:response regulator [Bacteroidales bacterium]MDY0253514.1 response regulator [Tenuifilaceae bacterium]
MDETAGKTKSPLKALVAEDDVVSRMLLAEILKKSSIEVDFARNGKEAVDKVREDSDSIDFILMDLKMPIMNGYEATLAIRALGFTKPIIAQTAYASQEDKERVLAGGFDAYLSKPVKKDVLLNLLDELW